MTENLTDAISTIKDHPEKAKGYYEKVQKLGLLDIPIRKDAWTPRQIFHHLADSHLNSYIRIKLALTEDHPTIKPYPEPEWVKLHDVEVVPIEVSLSILNGIHHRISTLLDHLAENDAEKFERTFHHPEAGDLTVGGYTVNFANHGESHLNGIKLLIENITNSRINRN